MAAAAADACAAPRSLFAVALEKLPSVRDSDGNILTAPFLDCCELIIPVIGAAAGLHCGRPLRVRRARSAAQAARLCMRMRPHVPPSEQPPPRPPPNPGTPPPESFGTAFAIVRSDIGGNVSRLRARLEAEPDRAARLFAIVEEDIARGDLGGTSCTKGLLWLKRCAAWEGGGRRGV